MIFATVFFKLSGVITGVLKSLDEESCLKYEHKTEACKKVSPSILLLFDDDVSCVLIVSIQMYFNKSKFCNHVEK